MVDKKFDPIKFASSDQFLPFLENLNIPIAFTDKNLVVQWCTKDFSDLLDEKDFSSLLKEKIKSPKKFTLKKSTKLITIFPFNNSESYALFLTGNKPNEQFRTIIHDINNLMTGILNSLDLIKDDQIEEEKKTRLLESLENNTVRAVEILENEASVDDYTEKNVRKINLSLLINELVSAISHQIKNGVEFISNTAKDLNPVIGNYTDIYRMLMNLIINANEAIEGSGQIILSAENKKTSQKDYVLVSIKDTGIGIPKENLEKIFTANFSTKNKKNESGLGLHIVKNILNNLNAEIDVKSSVNEGTEFLIKLPVYKSKERKKSDSGSTILVAEDEDLLRELLTDLLSSYNYTVVPVKNGRETIDELRKGAEVDLFIIDKKMPLMDGLSCIKKIRGVFPSIPIILASGSPSTRKEIKIEDLKVDKIINKPYNFEQLYELIKELLP